MSARILIVEDEPALIRGLRDTFEGKGYEVLVASDGASGLTAAVEQKPDLILLDIMLPKVNGYEICRVLRAKGLTMPVVMLTAKGQEQDIVLGLNLGADDYVTKPFRIAELVARVGAFLRRNRATPSNLIIFGPFHLDLAACRLFRDGQQVTLTAKEFALLQYFAARPGRALARNDVLDAVWGRSVIVTGRSVDRCVATLRAKIEDDPRNPIYIHTIRDIGYRFEPFNASPTPATS
jgi:DNA-binding response OmpR family regulator